MTRRLTATILTTLMMCAALAAAMNTARAQSLSATEILDKHVYSTNGYSLLIPSDWTTFGVSESEVDYGGTVGKIKIMVYGLEGQQAMLSIGKFTVAQWQSLTAEADGPIPVLLKEMDGSIYTYDIAQDFTDTVEKQSKEIDWMVDNIIFEHKNLTDVSSDSHFDAIQYLYDQQIVSGYPDGTYKPDQSINRAELMKILVGSRGINPDKNEFNSCFPDVQDEWFAPYVCYARKQNWIFGYPDGTFKPDQNVNKAEAIKMLINSQEMMIPGSVNENIFTDVEANSWYSPYIKTAKDKGILEDFSENYGIGEAITRGEISENIYRALLLAKFDAMADESVSDDDTSGTQETSESQETQVTTNGFALFVSDSFKFSIEYPEEWFYGSIETQDPNIIRRYDFGPDPIEGETTGIVTLELRSGDAPDGTVIEDFEGKTIVEVEEAGMVDVYYKGASRLYHLHGASNHEASMIKMAATVTELSS